MAKFNVGVIGAGYWGKKIVDEYSKLEEASLIGVADLDEKTSQTLFEAILDLSLPPLDEDEAPKGV